MLFFKSVMKCLATLSWKEEILAKVIFTPVALSISSHASINSSTQFAVGNNASFIVLSVAWTRKDMMDKSSFSV